MGSKPTDNLNQFSMTKFSTVVSLILTLKIVHQLFNILFDQSLLNLGTIVIVYFHQ